MEWLGLKETFKVKVLSHEQCILVKLQTQVMISEPGPDNIRQVTGIDSANCIEQHHDHCFTEKKKKNSQREQGWGVIRQE